MARDLHEPRGGEDASAAFQVPVDEALADWGRLAFDHHRIRYASDRAGKLPG